MLTVRKGSGDASQYYERTQTRADYYGVKGTVSASDAIAQELGIDPSRPITATELTRIMDGRRADTGEALAQATRHRTVQWADFTLSSGKSVSVAMALGSEHERAAIIGAHGRAAEQAMAYAQDLFAVTRRGAGGHTHVKGEWASVGFDHFTSRPSDRGTIDPQLHRHHVVSTAILAEGRLGALDLHQLRGGTVKEAGAVYQAALSRELRALGIEVRRGKHDEAEIAAIPRHVVAEFSGRHDELRQRAQDNAAAAGKQWSELSDGERLAWERDAATQARRAKGRTDDQQLDRWQQRAQAIGYQHRPLLRERRQELAPEAQRHEGAYRVAERLIGDAFAHDSVLPEAKIRELVARAYVGTGGMTDPRRDINGVMDILRARGIEHTALVFEDERVTTRLHIAQEREAIALAHKLHSEGRLFAEIGGAGSGKSQRLAEKAEVWRSEKRTIFAAALAWRQAGELPTDEQHRAALAPALSRLEAGKWDMKKGDVLVVDELGMLGTKDLLRTLRIADAKGASLYLAGDDKQAVSPSAGWPIEILRRAAVPLPEHLTNNRQREERQKQTASLWRQGRAAEALERMRADGDLLLVSGGRDATIAHVAEHHQGSLIMAPTNADARDISTAIRERRQAAGEIGPDAVHIAATDQNGVAYSMALASGDRVRLFDRVQSLGKDLVLGSNGDVVTVVSADRHGMTVRNARGEQGSVSFDSIRDLDSGRVRLAYGSALTIHAAQGSTVESSTFVLASGSQSLDLNRTYTALTRQRGNVRMVVNLDAERAAAEFRRPIGDRTPVTDADVFKALANNLSRENEREMASDLRAEHLERHVAAAIARVADAGQERQQHQRQGVRR